MLPRQRLRVGAHVARRGGRAAVVAGSSGTGQDGDSDDLAWAQSVPPLGPGHRGVFRGGGREALGLRCMGAGGEALGRDQGR